MGHDMWRHFAWKKVWKPNCWGVNQPLNGGNKKPKTWITWTLPNLI